MSYEPRPGSIAMRALHHLQKLAAGTEISTAALAEAVGIPPVNVIPNLQAAVQHGAVQMRKREPRFARSPLFWSMPGPGAPVVRPAAPAPVAAPPAAPAPAKPAPVLANPPSKAPEAQPLRIALWSDGTLQIERSTVGGAAGLVLLCKAEMRQLVAYLDSISLEAVRAE